MHRHSWALIETKVDLLWSLNTRRGRAGQGDCTIWKLGLLPQASTRKEKTKTKHKQEVGGDTKQKKTLHTICLAYNTAWSKLWVAVLGVVPVVKQLQKKTAVFFKLVLSLLVLALVSFLIPMTILPQIVPCQHCNCGPTSVQYGSLGVARSTSFRHLHVLMSLFGSRLFQLLCFVFLMSALPLNFFLFD